MIDFVRLFKKLFLSISLVFALTGVHAESCWQTIGCENLIGLIRVNKEFGKQEEGAKYLFGSKVLPPVNSVIELRRAANFREIFDSKKDDRILKLEDPVAIGGKEGDSLPAGLKVRILGYQLYNHLFVLVQILPYLSNPFEKEKEYKFDFNQVI